MAMTKCAWATLIVCLVCIPLILYLVFRIYVKYTDMKSTEYGTLLAKYNASLPPLTKSPVPCKVFYINLDRSTDRRSNFETQAKALMLDYQRISAVNGRLIKNVSGGSIGGLEYTNDFPNLSTSELACTLSHVKAIRTAYDQNLDLAMVCEDDASFELHRLWPDNLIQTLVDKLDPSIGILQLAWSFVNTTNPRTMCTYEKDYTIRPYPRGGKCWMTLAYIITRKGMEDVLTHSSHTSGNAVHLHSNGNTDMGEADAYIFQSTTTVNSGYPIMVPIHAASTTISDRVFANLAEMFTPIVRNKILSVYARNAKFVQKQIGTKPKIAQYRLSDAVCGRYRPLWTRAYHKKWYPNTLAGQYFKSTNRFNDMNVLERIVRSNRHVLQTPPPTDAVVVHLRLGDAIELCRFTVDEHLAKELPFTGKLLDKSIWVHSIPYYTQHLQQYPHIRKIILVYGKHGLTKTFPKTDDYLAKLTAHFESKGYDVSFHSSKDADQDFLYMCFAPYLIAGGGSGYANLARKMNQTLRKRGM